MKYSHYILTYLFIHIAFFGRAQNSFVYNLNSKNGLPSDNVYSIITDRNGYLWAATDKGIVKYNGYQCHVFTTADGLPSEDVWGLVEDLRGRIWIGCISGEMGYILNDKYYKANTNNISGTFYPATMRRYDSGIIFSSPHLNGLARHTICFNGNSDTMYAVAVNDKRIKTYDSIGYPFNTAISNNLDVVGSKDPFSHFVIHNITKIFDKPEKVYVTCTHQISPKYSADFYDNHLILPIGNFLAGFRVDGVTTNLILRNHVTGTEDSINIKQYGVNEPVEYAGYNNTIGQESILQIFTQTKVLSFRLDSIVSHISTYDISYRNQARKIKPSSHIRQGLWAGTCATLTNGLYLQKKNDYYNKSHLSLEGFEYVGTVSDSVSIWWSVDTKKMLFIINNRAIKEKSIIYGHDFSLAQLNKDTAILYGSLSYYLNLKTLNITPIPAFFNVHYVVRAKNGSYYVASKTSAHTINQNFDRETIQVADIDRYIGGSYDSANDVFWTYTRNKVLRLKNNDKKLFTRENILGNTTENIEKLLFDNTYRNMFIKTSNQLFCVDAETMKSTLISGNINLKEAYIDLYKNLLVVYGNFGIVFYKILGKGLLSSPVVYNNSREIHYNKAISVAFTKDIVTLLTNNGLYEVFLPKDDEYNQSKKIDYQFNIIIYCNNKIKKYTPSDVDTIDQVTRKFAIDVINPLGNGSVAYFYRFTDTGSWQKSTTGEILIPLSFSPDNRYTVSVFVMDDSWRSNTFSVQVYVKPKWWQTKNMSRIIWAGGLLLTALLVVIIVLVTRRIVLRSSAKKNMQMELELKAIYAQINPHFIFNTLTSALLLISNNRMDEAYNHVSKFSKLLRSYLKSSRNKYISIEEEIDNLKNYVELQQTRFKDKFVSEIIIDPELNIGQAKIPSLLIQPFVENAINHGLLHQDKQGRLTIEFAYSVPDNKIICTISDNGIGRQQSRENKKGTENTLGSYGNLMIKDLVNIFNRYEKIHIDVSYIDKKAPETGTSVVITITNPIFQ